MAKAYTKEDVVGAALYRFRNAKIDVSLLEPMYNKFYDERGKEEFRKYASVDAEAMKLYFESLKNA